MTASCKICGAIVSGPPCVDLKADRPQVEFRALAAIALSAHVAMRHRKELESFCTDPMASFTVFMACQFFESSDPAYAAQAAQVRAGLEKFLTQEFQHSPVTPAKPRS